eukprot:3645686-Prymnesium_polylepis.1
MCTNPRPAKPAPAPRTDRRALSPACAPQRFASVASPARYDPVCAIRPRLCDPTPRAIRPYPCDPT